MSTNLHKTNKWLKRTLMHKPLTRNNISNINASEQFSGCENASTPRVSS